MNTMPRKEISLNRRIANANRYIYSDLRCTFPLFEGVAQMPLSEYFTNCYDSFQKLQKLSKHKIHATSTYRDAAAYITDLHQRALSIPSGTERQKNSDYQLYCKALELLFEPLLIDHEEFLNNTSI